MDLTSCDRLYYSGRGRVTSWIVRKAPPWLSAAALCDEAATVTNPFFLAMTGFSQNGTMLFLDARDRRL